MGPHHLLAIVVGLTIIFLALIVLLVIFLEVYFGMGLLGTLVTLLGIYVSLPVLFYFSKAVQRQLIFMNFFFWSPGKRFYEPETHGVEGGRNFYLYPEPDVKLGVWHILPKSEIKKSKGKDGKYWESSLAESGRPVIIYFHGNMGTRGTTHRIELYKVFQQEDCHVIAFDYRGFADSTGSPSETGLVADGRFVYSWLRSIIGHQSSVPIYFWGHSLGTGVLTHLAADLCTSCESLNMAAPAGIFLEAPFTNMADTAKTTISSAIFRPLPGSGWLISSRLKRNDLAFESDRHIEHVNIPITILHNTKDNVVQYRLGKELCSIGNQLRPPKTSTPITLHTFKGSCFSSAHVHICREPELGQIIRDFLQSSSRDSRSESILR